MFGTSHEQEGKAAIAHPGKARRVWPIAGGH